MTVPVTCAVGLRCIECGAEHPLEYLLQCRQCRGLLEPVYDLEPLRRLGPAAAFTERGLWRYHAILPIRDAAHFVSLGEGDTPLLDAPALARTLGVRRCAIGNRGHRGRFLGGWGPRRRHGRDRILCQGRGPRAARPGATPAPRIDPGPPPATARTPFMIPTLRHEVVAEVHDVRRDHKQPRRRAPGQHRQCDELRGPG